MTITAQQFEAALDEGFDYEFTGWKGDKSIERMDSGEFWYEGHDHESFQIDGLGLATYVAGETGGEGSAEYIWQVWQIGDQFFKKEGYYMSYDGSNWDGDLFEVEPFEKVVTDYQVKK